MAPRFFTRPIDLVITLLLWVYFTAGFLALFSPLYVLAYCFPGRRADAYQALNHYFYRGLFLLIRVLLPRQAIDISPEVRALRSSVIVSNHVSYLDPLLLISVFKRHKTIVKASLFKLPIFGFIVKTAGYMPSAAEGKAAEVMIEQVGTLASFLNAGGNLFVFPEGTRSRDGELGRLNRGVFKIARKRRVPIHVLRITNADKLFPPGRFLFNTCQANTITVTLLGSIVPDDTAPVSTKELVDRARQLLGA